MFTRKGIGSGITIAVMGLSNSASATDQLSLSPLKNLAPRAVKVDGCKDVQINLDSQGAPAKDIVTKGNVEISLTNYNNSNFLELTCPNKDGSAVVHLRSDDLVGVRACHGANVTVHGNGPLKNDTNEDIPTPYKGNDEVFLGTNWEAHDSSKLTLKELNFSGRPTENRNLFSSRNGGEITLNNIHAEVISVQVDGGEKEGRVNISQLSSSNSGTFSRVNVRCSEKTDQMPRIEGSKVVTTVLKCSYPEPCVVKQHTDSCSSAFNEEVSK